ncbi:MAG: hypothetical protein B6U65_00665 [Candidatus Wolframiiraptor sp. EX4484-121]|nr:MAG: hypothetical protein B6U65_00665 [Candidatus Wolframiiraptor sp. EX4484-121]
MDPITILIIIFRLQRLIFLIHEVIAQLFLNFHLIGGFNSLGGLYNKPVCFKISLPSRGFPHAERYTRPTCKFLSAKLHDRLSHPQPHLLASSGYRGSLELLHDGSEEHRQILQEERGRDPELDQLFAEITEENLSSE